MARSLLAAFAVAASLTGCSAGPLSQQLEQMPQSLGGLPPDAPQQPPSDAYAYPAVHDMPAPRSTEPMSDEQQYQLEKDLARARDRLEAAQGQDTGDKTDQKTAKKVAKKKPTTAKNGQNAGANTGTKTNP